MPVLLRPLADPLSLRIPDQGRKRGEVHASHILLWPQLQQIVYVQVQPHTTVVPLSATRNCPPIIHPPHHAVYVFSGAMTGGSPTSSDGDDGGISLIAGEASTGTDSPRPCNSAQ
jgi:hypothetical protein